MVCTYSCRRYCLENLKMKHCECCKESLDGKHFWEVSEEWQVCHQRVNGLPEVDITTAIVLGDYCSMKHAMDACVSYLSGRNAKPTWADVSSAETCACCGNTFDTSARHLTLTLMEMSGSDDANIHDLKYVARFCRSCMLPEVVTSKLADSTAPVITVQPKWVGKN